MAPLISLLCEEGIVEATAAHQTAIFEAATQFARTEGIISAPEPAHAIHVAIKEALKCKETGEAKNILFLLCGHGYFDMSAYDAYFAGTLEDFAYPEDEIRKTLAAIPQI